MFGEKSLRGGKEDEKRDGYG